MKKLFALVLVLALALCAPAALAAELNWSDFESEVGEIEAEFVTFDEVAVKMWMPTALQAVELSDEDVENGYIAYFTPEDESAAVAVQYVDVEGMSLDDYAAALPELGATGIEPMTINGLPAIGYDIEESDTSALAFATEAGYIFEISFAPVSDEGFSSLVMIMLASIQEA